jgi:hypothetical protein
MSNTYQDELRARLNPGRLRPQENSPASGDRQQSSSSAAVERQNDISARLIQVNTDIAKVDALLESTTEALSHDLLARKNRLLMDKLSLESLKPSNLDTTTVNLTHVSPGLGITSSTDRTYTAELNVKKAQSVEHLQKQLLHHNTVLSAYKTIPPHMTQWKDHLQQSLVDVTTMSSPNKYLHTPPKVAPKTGLKQHDHLIRLPHNDKLWSELRRDGNIFKPDGTEARHSYEHLQAVATYKAGGALRPPKLKTTSIRITKQTSTILLTSALSTGLDLLELDNFDVKGWTKDISIICHGLDNAPLQTIFNNAAGWDDVELDPYDLGITCCVPGTQKNKLSMLNGFLLYCHHLDKKAPWTLQDIYSFQLRLVEGGRQVRTTHFNGIVSALAPLNLLRSNGLFSTIKTDLGRQIGNSSEKQDVKKCPPWNGLCDLRIFSLQPAKKLMLALWVLSGARFSTICQLTAADVAYITVKGFQCTAITLWFDKIFDRQGRTVVLTCNCSPGIPAELQLCPTCPKLSIQELQQAFTLDGWFALQKTLGCPYHAMRRRVAIEIAKLNNSRSVTYRIPMQSINIYMGWVLTSHMHREYIYDLDKHEDKIFPIATPSLLHNLQLTTYIESDLALSDKAIRQVRHRILKSTKLYKDKLQANDRLWQDFRLQIPQGALEDQS